MLKKIFEAFFGSPKIKNPRMLLLSYKEDAQDRARKYVREMLRIAAQIEALAERIRIWVQRNPAPTPEQIQVSLILDVVRDYQVQSIAHHLVNQMWEAAKGTIRGEIDRLENAVLLNTPYEPDEESLRDLDAQLHWAIVEPAVRKAVNGHDPSLVFEFARNSGLEISENEIKSIFGRDLEYWRAQEKPRPTPPPAPRPKSEPLLYVDSPQPTPKDEINADHLKMAETGQQWALLVGVDTYDDSANFASLDACGKDVRALKEQLVQNGWKPEHIKVLDGAPELLPTHGRVLSELQTKAESAGSGDLLLFFFSGHGIIALGRPDAAGQRKLESYLISRDGAYNTPHLTALALSEIKRIMQDSRARAKVIILDACHSGASIGKDSPAMTEDFIRKVYAEAEGICILSSCKEHQRSYERPEKDHSVYAYYFLEALRGAAPQRVPGLLTVEDVFNYVAYKVKTWAQDNRRSQHPTMTAEVSGVIVLGWLAPEAKPASPLIETPSSQISGNGSLPVTPKDGISAPNSPTAPFEQRQPNAEVMQIKQQQRDALYVEIGILQKSWMFSDELARHRLKLRMEDLRAQIQELDDEILKAKSAAG